jgi:uncharacterized repeat protein (TIGR04138 family)
MQSAHFENILDAIVQRDPRYPREAYHFVREALDFTQRTVHRDLPPDAATENRHVSGQQLLDGIRDFALQTFGPMSFNVLQSWGIHRCDQFGDLVFNLVEHGQGMFGKTDQDSRDDFKEGYDFHDAFRRPFLPSSPSPSSPRQMREA